MKTLFAVPSLSVRVGASLGVAALAASLAGCYVVPMDPYTGQPVAVATAPAAKVAPAPVAVTFPARLYPENELASAYGVINATVTNDMHGRGTFNANINGEHFSGEATRKAGSSRDGVASGAGNRGSYLSCQYTMNSPALGTGRCQLSNGAAFSMHIGN